MRLAGLAGLASAAALAFALPAEAQAPVRARITGIIWDSVTMRPMRGATVRIVRADNLAEGRSATTDVTGSFRYDTVPAGTWLATYLHPVLDSVRIEPAIVRIDITDSSTVDLPLATPSVRTVINLTCRPTLGAEYGMVIGEVRRADDLSPVADANVQMEWPEWVLQRGRMTTDLRRLVARTDAEGRYALCGVPAGNTVRAFAYTRTDTTGAVELDVPPSAYGLQDFRIATLERLIVRLDSTSTSTATATAAPPAAPAAAAVTTTVRRGRATVRGVVRTLDGRPLSNAVVRVIGSGSQARSRSDGTFSITDAGGGTQTVEARAIGFQPTRIPVQLRDDHVTALILRLSVQRVQLDTVRVVAGKQIAPEVRAIERRWRAGVGVVLDAKAVRERSVLFVSDALRGLNGVSVNQVGSFGQAVMMRSPFNGAECLASIVVDGQLIPKNDNAQVTLDDLARREDVTAIEVYARANLVPPEFSSLATGCGVVVMWTKRATGGVSPLPPSLSRP
jgi:hypothetical protein